VSDFKLSKSSIHEERVIGRSGDSLGLSLGELRAAVTAAEGLSDDSTVLFEGLSGSVMEGEYYAKVIIIRERSKAS
jgi:hypothetical protein